MEFKKWTSESKSAIAFGEIPVKQDGLLYDVATETSASIRYLHNNSVSRMFLRPAIPIR